MSGFPTPIQDARDARRSLPLRLFVVGAALLLTAFAVFLITTSMPFAQSKVFRVISFIGLAATYFPLGMLWCVSTAIKART